MDNEASANENDASSTNMTSVISLPPHTTHLKSRSRRQPYWWAPGATRSPNLMHESPPADDISSDEDDDDVPTNLAGTPQRPRLEMHWCCLRPCFSGGGGIGFTAPFCGGDIRAAPLPQGRGYDDPAFLPTLHETNDPETTASSSSTTHSHNNHSYQFPYRTGHPQFDILPYIEQPKQSSPSPACPRSLCATCYDSPAWKVQCPACNNPICIEHEVKTLKARKCGYRNLLAERASVQQTKELLNNGDAVPKHLASASRSYFHAKWLGIMARMNEADDVRRLNGQWAPDMTRRPLGMFSSFHARDPMANGQYHQQQQQQTTTMPEFVWDSSLSQTTSVGPADDHQQQSTLLGDHLNPQQQQQQQQQQPELSSSSEFSQPTSTPLSRSVSTSALALATNTTIVNDAPGVTPSTALQTSIWYSPLPLQTPWTGCGMLFCPPDRYPGDWRPHCSNLNTNLTTTTNTTNHMNHPNANATGPLNNANANPAAAAHPIGTAHNHPTNNTHPPITSCTLCSTNVCLNCRLSTPPCPCTVCTARGYICPNCANRADVRAACKGVEEEMERRRAEKAKEGQRERLRMEVRGWWDEQRREREAADELCVGMAGLFGDVET
ncbi:MAG: hypothetical protein M1831_004072 [Alyxoria varia]|nr:MAG: hypothetical protein M1831_004072 [Alyxoria varia]